MGDRLREIWLVVVLGTGLIASLLWTGLILWGAIALLRWVLN